MTSPIPTPLVVQGARLGGALRRAAARRAGQAVWFAPELLSVDRWLERLLLDASLRGEPALPSGFVLSPTQARALWLEVIGRERALAPRLQEQLASRALEAHALIAEWQLEAALQPYVGGLPAFDALVDWRRRFRARCRELDALAAPDLLRVAQVVERHHRPATFVGFGRIGPALAALGVPVPAPVDAVLPASLQALPTREDEYRAACEWALAARARGLGTVAVVLPDAASIEACAALAMRETSLHEDAPLLMAGGGAGSPLHLPMVVSALQLLALARGLEPLEAAALVQSPYLAGHAAEAGPRARLAAELLALRKDRWPGEALLARAAPRCPRLAARLRAVLVATAQSPRRQSLNAWMQQAQQCLAAAGWPGEQALSALEKAGKEALAQAFDLTASLDAVCAPLSAAEAETSLRRILRERRLNLPVAADAVELLTLEEAAALAPDAVWVLGLNEGSWPRARAQNPLLPQRPLLEAGAPGANGVLDLAFERACLSRLAAGAREMVLSCARLEGETELRPAPGFAWAAQTPVAMPIAPAEAEADCFEAMPSLQPVPLAPARAASLAGGARVLTDQAACPFRAFAAHRLHATGVALASAGPDARERGNLLHEVLAAFWAEVDSQAMLKGLSEDAREALIAGAVAAGLAKSPALAERLHGLEHHRLKALLRRWLAYEEARPAFSVLEVECERRLELGGLAFKLRIDRIDRLADGRLLVVDYKSGQVAARDWQPPRPDAPQLPLYALAEHPQEVAGIAFASLKRQAMRWVTAPKNLFKAAPDAASLTDALAAWRDALTMLAAEVMAGEARVDPKHGKPTCARCEFALLCRVHEQPPQPEEEEADEPV